MRVGNEWQDVAIRNVSSRGMMLSAEDPPAAGSYIEIRKAMIVVVARAVWVRDDFFGVRTQDRIDVSDLLENAAAKPTKWTPDASQDRRNASRPAETAERNRQRSRLFQFALSIGVVATIAVVIALEVADVLAKPLGAVRAALGG